MIRWYGNDHLITAYDKAEAIAKTLDRLGFDTFWMAEHHFQPEGYECIPNILMLAVHLAHVTERINIGCGFNIAPMWHPLRLAEDFATADILTKGRTIFGVGRGYHTREVDTFGAPLMDQEANRNLFEEQVDIIFQSFNEESFSHKGEYYTIPPEVPYRGYTLKEITLVPRPATLPVECWQPIQSATPRGLDFMAKHGIKGVIGGGVAEGGAMDRVIEAYRDANARAGRDLELGENLSIGFHFYIADTQEEAIAAAGNYYEETSRCSARSVWSARSATIRSTRCPTRHEPRRPTCPALKAPLVQEASSPVRRRSSSSSSRSLRQRTPDWTVSASATLLERRSRSSWSRWRCSPKK